MSMGPARCERHDGLGMESSAPCTCLYPPKRCVGCQVEVPYTSEMQWATRTDVIRPLCPSCYARLAAGLPIGVRALSMPLLWEGDQA